MNIRDTSEKNQDKGLTYLNTEMIDKDQATENELGFVMLASEEDIKKSDPKKVVTAKELNKTLKEIVRIDGGNF